MASPYSDAQLQSIAKAGGFPDPLLPTMAAIAMAESSGDAQIVQKGQPYATTGWGLWQITPGNSVPQVGVDNALLDPVTNAKAAYIKWQSQGLGAWTTYTSGKFNSFLHGPAAPTNFVNPGGGSQSGGGGGTAAPASFWSDPLGIGAVEGFAADAVNYGLWVAMSLAGFVLMGAGLFLLARQAANAGGVAGAYTGAVKHIATTPLRYVRGKR